MNLEVASATLGLLSGLVLSITAWRNDRLLLKVSSLKKKVEAAAAQNAQDEMAAPTVASLEADVNKWTWLDRWSLRIGVMLLFASFGCSLANSLCKPPASGAFVCALVPDSWVAVATASTP